MMRREFAEIAKNDARPFQFGTCLRGHTRLHALTRNRESLAAMIALDAATRAAQFGLLF